MSAERTPSLADFDASLDAIGIDDETETPTSPAAPDADDAAPASADPAPSPASGPARDDKGRFAPKAPDAPSADPAPVAASDASVPPVEAPAVPEPVAAAVQPFTVRSGGTEHPVEWVQPQPDGTLLVPAEHAALFRQHVSEAITRRTVDREQRVQSANTIRALQEQLTQQTAEQETAMQLMQMLATTPEDQAWDAIAEFRAGYPELMLKIERDRRTRLEEQIRKGVMPPDLSAMTHQPAEPTPPDEATRSAALAEAVTEAKQFLPGSEVLTEEDWQLVNQTAEIAGDALFRRVTDAEAMQAGLEPGSYAFDGPRYAKLVQQQITVAKARQQMAKAVADAAAKNRAQVPAPATPPTSAPKGAPVAPKQQTPPRSKHDWERQLNSITLD